MLNIFHDPEAVIQDADIEMLEAADAANNPDFRDPWTVCGYCGGTAVGTIQYWTGHRTLTTPYCQADRAEALAEKAHFDSLDR